MITRRTMLRGLRGLGGALVALPFLESVKFLGGNARAAGARPRVYSFFLRQGNGVQQGYDTEPDRFWPRAKGALTQQSLGSTNSDRAVAVLADHAEKLTLVSGTKFGFNGAGCGHSGGLNQCLTAAQVTGMGATSLATGESIDWMIANRINEAGIEPLTLMAGPQSAYIAHGLSYSGPSQLRGAKNNPFSVYTGLMGLSGSTPELLQQIATRRRSVNDLVRDEMKDLMAKPDLSASDKQRLELHFQAIRDIEVGMACQLPDSEVANMQALNDAYEANDNVVEVADMMCSLAALAFACDATRTGTLQIGTGNDQTRYLVNGQRQNTFHKISHRINSDGATGDPIPGADLLHHEIDKIFAGIFKRFLDKLDGYTGPSGNTLLDDSVVLWTNDLSNGPPHSYSNVPQVMAGGAAGFLKTGQYVDAGDVTHNKFLNTIINAVGIRNADDSYYDSFGDPSLQRGVIDSLIA